MGRALRRTAVSVAAAAAIVITAPFLVPASYFVPELERFAAERLGQPVAIEDLTLRLLPTPRMVGHGITVGRKRQIAIAELEIEPDLRSLVSGPYSVRLIRASRVVLEENAIQTIRSMPKRRPGEPVVVQRLVLTAVKLGHPTLELPLFDVDLQLDEGSRVREARFYTPRGGSVRLALRPLAGDATAVTISATDWTLPAGPPVTFEKLAAQGTLKGQQLELASIEADLYGGKLFASAQAEWGKQLQIAGRAELARVDLVPLQKALGKYGKLSGRLNADAAFSSQAKTAAELRDALALDGPFEILGGVYQGVDLSRAGEATAEGQGPAATRFEELKGVLQLRGEHVRLSRLCMRSPSLVAGGNVDIAPDNRLSGKLDISMAQTGGFFGAPFALGGTTDYPALLPSKGYLIGGAIGTALLPGLGTSIGMSLGGRIEGTSDCK